jgi:hypothetical protein
MKLADCVRLLAFTTLITSAVACGGTKSTTEDGTGTGPPGPTTAAEFCDTLYGTFAQRFADCSKAPLAWATHTVDKAKLCANLVKAVAAGKATYDQSASGSCLASIESASCSDLRAIRDDVKFVAACQAAVEGTGFSGFPYTACYSDYECSSGRCTGGGGVCPDICYQGYAAGGGPCYADRDCGVGLYCYSGALWPNRTCQPYTNRPGENQVCTIGTGCLPGLYCDGSISSVDPGTCKPQLTAGTCPSDPKATAPGYGCFSGTVQALLGTGETCSATADHCGPGLYCGAGNVCTQQPMIGEPCVYYYTKYQGCLGGYCDTVTTLTCKHLSPSSCYSDWDCESTGFCEGGCQGYCTAP